MVADFGPSLSAFPTPVAVLIGRALPWTVALLVISTSLTWVLGNLLGGLAGYYRRNRLLRFAGLLAMAFHPVPYYIVAFVLLIVFGYLWPVLPISGGYTMNMTREWSWQFIGSLAAGQYHSVALCSDGTVAAWGRNFEGELGDGTLTQRQTPVRVSTEPGASALSQARWLRASNLASSRWRPRFETRRRAFRLLQKWQAAKTVRFPNQILVGSRVCLPSSSYLSKCCRRDSRSPA